MSGNATDTDDAPVRLYPNLLVGCGNHPCDVCGGHLPDHDWADLNPDGNGNEIVVDCSEQAR